MLLGHIMNTNYKFVFKLQVQTTQIQGRSPQSFLFYPKGHFKENLGQQFYCCLYDQE